MIKTLYKLAYNLYSMGFFEEAESIDSMSKFSSKEDLENDARSKKKKKKKKVKRDACYYKVRSRYDVWPSAYASGALVKCREVGAKNWGEGGKKKKKKKSKKRK